jgi:hypothetical protein
MWSYRPDENGVLRLTFCGDCKRHGHCETDENDYDGEAQQNKWMD